MKIRMISQRIKNETEGAVGWLVGIKNEDDTFSIGCSRVNSLSNDRYDPTTGKLLAISRALENEICKFPSVNREEELWQVNHFLDRAHKYFKNSTMSNDIYATNYNGVIAEI